MNLQLLIDKEAFIACPLVDALTFQTFCRDRGISVSRARLEAFERIGVIHPLLRMDVSGGRPGFWTKEVLKEMQQDGRVWFSSERPFAAWSTFFDTDGRTKVESLYSTFQCIQVEEAVQRLSLHVSCEAAPTMAEADLQKWGQKIVDWAKQLATVPTLSSTISKAPIVCQLLANRYFFKTQSDRRTIQISQPFRPDKWDWYDYAREWKAEQELKDMSIAPEILVQIHDTIKARARHIDPLERWHSLVSFVSVDKRKRLKNAALYAQTLYSMEAMLRMFLEETTGAKLAAPDENLPGDQDSFYGAGVTQNEL
ncbi:MAG: hypothetical protein AB1705_26500, partial [Verrucomicrobiota bacterium]